jgi:F-type H+-transporting ATPase subunit delta
MSNKMSVSKIAAPYASALLDLAISTHTVDCITKDVNELLQVFNENKNLVDYLSNPLYPKSSKKNVLLKVTTPLLLSRNTTRFLYILVDRSRVEMFSAIAVKFLQQVYDLAEIKIAKITSAIPLLETQSTKICDQLRIGTGAKDIKMITIVDKTLLGGFQIQIGSNILDYSLKGQLKKLATKLETTLF